MMVKIDITANNLSEKNRVIATYAGVLNGFFIKNGFYPLPGVGVLNKVDYDKLIATKKYVELLPNLRDGCKYH